VATQLLLGTLYIDKDMDGTGVKKRGKESGAEGWRRGLNVRMQIMG